MAHMLTISVFSAIAMVAAAPLAGARRPAIGRPGCETKCGGMSVPFPFGLGPPHCSATPGFNLTCDNTTRPGAGGKPRLLLGNDGSFEVREFFLPDSFVSVARLPVFANVSVSAGETVYGSWGGAGLRDDVGQFTLEGVTSRWGDMETRNELVVVGCNVRVTLYTSTPGQNAFVVGCSAYCPHDRRLVAQDVRNYTGARGNCRTRINTFQTSYRVELKRVGGDRDTDTNANLPVYAFIAEEDWFGADLAIELLNLGGRNDAPLMPPVFLGWYCFNDGSCNKSVSANSECSTAKGSADPPPNTPIGEALFRCACLLGYEGNPYITGGCQDIDECKRPKEFGCFGECTNYVGSFRCRCPRGSHGNATFPGGCVQFANNTGLIIGLSVATLPCLVLLVLCGFFIDRKLKRHTAEKLKHKFFNQNHGQLLQQLISQRSDIGDRMIIPLKELQKATNYFDHSRKLGGGGHGTVYKGILSDLHVVAIKKSNIVVQREIDEFINEVVILSQINHRNIVKLHGCCLETEVPLLAYEFISNGTLDDHLHRESPTSIPWGDRLRIACEVGKAISYLHSAVSVPVIHRDIKSSNILLDDALIAKVSDFGASRYIPIVQTGITATVVQGTIGYLDPMYYYTGRLSESSDVYSFGVLLVELLTRKMPIKFRSSEGDGLVVHFVELLEQGNLGDILDSQVVEEGGSEVEQVAALAASCIKLRGEERPTMRQVEMALEGLQASKERAIYGLHAERNEVSYITPSYPSTRRSTSFENGSTRYTDEEEFPLSARYPH